MEQKGLVPIWSVCIYGFEEMQNLEELSCILVLHKPEENTGLPYALK